MPNTISREILSAGRTTARVGNRAKNNNEMSAERTREDWRANGRTEGEWREAERGRVKRQATEIESVHSRQKRQRGNGEKKKCTRQNEIHRRINAAEGEKGRKTKRGYEKAEEKGKGERGREEWKICETFNRRVEQSLRRNICLKKRHWKSLSARISSILNIKWAMRFFSSREKSA